MIRNKSILVLSSVFLLGLVSQEFARANDLTVTDGEGEGIRIKKGLLGNKTTVVQDRLGNSFYNKKGFFNTKDTEVSVLGNQFRRKKGILGGSDIQGHTILGDTITTKKNIFGKRKTTVDLSGVTKTVHNFFDSTKAPPTPALGSRYPAPSSNPLEQDVLKDSQP